MIDAIAALASSTLIALGPQSLIALTAVVMIGLPHGAFDGAVALALGYGKSLKSMLGFILGYIAIAASVVVFWMMFADLALILFLTISVLHFGIGDRQSGGWLTRTTQTISHGGLVVIGISIRTNFRLSGRKRNGIVVAVFEHSQFWFTSGVNSVSCTSIYAASNTH
jgi:Brp/Blh family beta-carotene 15,15'-monooxygenase